MCQGLNSHYFHIIGDGHPIVGVYIPIIRIPIKGGMTIPNKTQLLTMAHITFNKKSSSQRFGEVVMVGIWQQIFFA